MKNYEQMLEDTLWSLVKAVEKEFGGQLEHSRNVVRWLTHARALLMMTEEKK